MNKYPYVINNPINRLDPLGELSLSQVALIVAIISTLFLVSSIGQFGCNAFHVEQRLEEAALRGISNDPKDAEEIAQVFFGKNLGELTREELVEVGKQTPEFRRAVAVQGARLIKDAIDVELNSIPSPHR